MKAARHLGEGRVSLRELDLYAGVVAADVKGDGAVWNTYHDETGWHCNCPAFGRCAHMLALGLIATVEPRETT